MTTSAPILRSIFDREVQVLDKNGASRSVTIPLVVADRGLREVSEGARLLSVVLEAMGSRASRTSVMNVLTVDAETADGEVMAVSHATRPVYGVQFHPESIGSQFGKVMLGNFLRKAGLK